MLSGKTVTDYVNTKSRETPGQARSDAVGNRNAAQQTLRHSGLDPESRDIGVRYYYLFGSLCSAWFDICTG